jgi:hypothetical protein
MTILTKTSLIMTLLITLIKAAGFLFTVIVKSCIGNSVTSNVIISKFTHIKCYKYCYYK